MGVLLNGVKVGLPYRANNGQPVFWNALYDGVQVWPPAAETLVDVWLKPVDFTAQALYADHPEVKVAAQKVFADGHIEDANLTLSTADTTVASINAGTVSFVSNASNFLTVLKQDAFNACHVSIGEGGKALGVKQVLVQPDQPSTVPVAVCGAAPRNSTMASSITPAQSATMRMSCASSSTVSAKYGAKNGMIGSF